jgi:hypothetical protein
VLDSPDVGIHREGLADLQERLATAIADAPARAMQQSGLAGATGGVHVQVGSDERREILFPLPQLADGQVPICYFISSTPADAMTEVSLRKRDACNVVVVIRIAAGQRDVKITWSSLVLLASHSVTPNTTSAQTYRTSTACAQSRGAKIAKLAGDLWPKSEEADDFAVAIQQHIRDMKRTRPPRSLDALGIFESGENSICTANANLAAALMRSKGIACGSIAVIPPIGQRLEMHRIVEFFDDGKWIAFDPSSLQTDIPAKPWQNIIMAKTTIEDEEQAMTPRMGVMNGCPYAQEVELLSPGVSLSGADFFWTTEAMHLAADAWNRFLQSGSLTQGQIKAASARTLAEVVDDLKADTPAPQNRVANGKERQYDEAMREAKQSEVLGYVLGGAGIVLVLASIPAAIWWERRRRARRGPNM